MLDSHRERKAMTSAEKADKVVKILKLIDEDVRHAFRLQSYFCRAAYNNDVKKYFNQSKAAPGYNQICNSLYFEFIMTLTRLFDNFKRKKNTHNTASLPELMSLLSETEVVDELQRRSEQRKTPSEDLEKNLEFSDADWLKELKDGAKQSACNERSLISGLLQDFEKLKGNHLLGRLRIIRNELLAHTAIERNKNNSARYGDPERFLQKTAQFVASLNSAVESLHNDYKEHIKTWQEHADYFWEYIVGNNIEKPTSQSLTNVQRNTGK